MSLMRLTHLMPLSNNASDAHAGGIGGYSYYQVGTGQGAYSYPARPHTSEHH
jgi:hypothetical protein